MIEEKKHARFAASSSERWMNCHGSVKLSEKAPKQKEGAAAKEGTLAHSLMEFALNANVKNVASFFDRDDYPKDMMNHVQGFIDFVKAHRPEGSDLLVEEKIQLDFLHPSDAFGTVDVAIVDPFSSIHIIDFKYGMGYVGHIENPQMMYYALGLGHKNHFDFDEVTTTIYQPRISGKAARSHVFPTKVLKEWEEKFKGAIELCESADPKKDLVCGKWCKFCPAKILCPAITEGAMKSAMLDFEKPVQPDPKTLTSFSIKTLLDKAAYLEMWIKEVKAYAENEIAGGSVIDGWGLVDKRSQRKWASPDLVSIDWPIDGGLLIKHEMISPSEAEKVLTKSGVDKSIIESFLKDNVVHVSSGKTLSQTEITNYFADGLEITEGD